jgi:hypothetical protein
VHGQQQFTRGGEPVTLMRWFAVGSSLVIVSAACNGCSGQSGSGALDSTLLDAAENVDSYEAQTCSPHSPLIVIPYAPPTPFHQGLCTGTQIDAYVTDYKFHDTEAFRRDSANSACLACIETPSGAALHGPVVVEKAGSVVEILQTNYGGCVANLTRGTSKTGCGELLDAFNTCAFQECGDCTDYSSGGKHAVDCLTSAVASDGPCEPYWGSDVAACQKDLASGEDSTLCTSLDTFLSTWCGRTGK